MDSLERIKKQLRNLKQNRELSEEELQVKAQEQLERQEILNNLTFCIDDKEKDFAANLLNSYLAESAIESFSDKDTLRQLIDLEVVLERIKSFLNTEYAKSNPAIPTQMLDQLQELNNQALKLKESLGLLNKTEEKADFVEILETLKKKALQYYKEHAGCNVVRCPYCQNLFQLLMNTKDLEVKKLPWFKGTILYNKKLFDLYHNKKVNEDEVAEILGVSKFYVNYIYETVYLKEIDKEKE